MKKSDRIKRVIIAIAIAFIFLSLAPLSKVSSYASGGKVVISMIGKYDSEDVATIREIDVDNKIIRFRNHATGRNYTLSYDNTSMMYDMYGSALSPRLLNPGQIVDVKFLKSAKTITTLSVSKDAWYIDSTRDHNLVRNDGTAVVKGSVYKIDPRTMVLAEGNAALAEDVLSTDSVAVSGVGKDIYSVVVTSGHGYVSLSSDVVEDQSLVGAWLELDNAVIHKISPNMLLSAPEGDYNLQIIGNGANYQSKVNITRNQETVIDTSDVNIVKPKEGIVTFEITPDNADVFVDGQRMLTGVPQTVQYGYHNLKIMADGYETQTKYLKVGTPKSVISIELEKDASSEETSDSSDEASSELSITTFPATAASTANSIQEVVTDVSALATTQVISQNSSTTKSVASNTVINGYKIYIDKPYGAEIYFDGSYLGIAPTNITKISGTHEIIVKAEGYETRSYRINIDGEETNLVYEFPDLVKIVEESTTAASSASTSSSADAASTASTSDGAALISTSDSGTEASTDAGTDASSEATSGKSDDSGESSSDKSSESSTDASKESSADSSTDASTEASTDESGEFSSDNYKESPAEASTKASDSGDGASTNENSTKEEVSDAASTASASS